MSRRQWALVIVLVLVNYIIFASLFNVVFSNRPDSTQPTRTPLPTFTPAPSPTPVVLAPTDTPVPPLPSPTGAPVGPDGTPAATASAPPEQPAGSTPPPPTQAQPLPTQPAPPPATQSSGSPSVTVDVSLNVRSGPGTNYERVGSVPPGSTVEITGRNAVGTWWQIPYAGAAGGIGWISAGFGIAQNTDGVPIVEAPPPPAPAAPAPPPTSPPPAASATPALQFSPLAWEGQWNGGLAQIRGHIKDTAGNPVSGMFVQAKCGDTILASNPSGINLYSPGEGYEAGAYDIILSSPLSADSMCNWEVRVVQASSYDEAKSLGATSLSSTGYCDLAWDEMSICFAEWRKNW